MSDRAPHRTSMLITATSLITSFQAIGGDA